MKITIPTYTAEASGNLPEWSKRLLQVIKKFSPEMRVLDVLEDGAWVSQPQMKAALKQLKLDGFKVKELSSRRGNSYEVRHYDGAPQGLRINEDSLEEGEGPSYGIFLFDTGPYAGHASSDTTSFVGTAAKAPSPKAVKKASAVLKKKKAAQGDKIAAKAQKSIDALVKMDAIYKENFKASEAQIAKLEAQIQRIKGKQDRAEQTFIQKSKVHSTRINAVRQKLIDRGHADLTLPRQVLDYVSAVHKTGSENGPSKKMKKRNGLGKGLRDLTGDEGKTKKAVNKMTD